MATYCILWLNVVYCFNVSFLRSSAVYYAAPSFPNNGRWDCLYSDLWINVYLYEMWKESTSSSVKCVVQSFPLQMPSCLLEYCSFARMLCLKKPLCTFSKKALQPIWPSVSIFVLKSSDLIIVCQHLLFCEMWKLKINLERIGERAQDLWCIGVLSVTCSLRYEKQRKR